MSGDAHVRICESLGVPCPIPGPSRRRGLDFHCSTLRPRQHPRHQSAIDLVNIVGSFRAQSSLALILGGAKMRRRFLPSYHPSGCTEYGRECLQNRLSCPLRYWQTSSGPA
jgi:hypothetical protein